MVKGVNDSEVDRVKIGVKITKSKSPDKNKSKISVKAME